MLSGFVIPFICLWVLITLGFLFKKGVHPVWKIGVVLVLLFYILWFWPVLDPFLKSVQAHPLELFLTSLKTLLDAMPILLLLLWPISLFSGILLPDTFTQKRVRNLLLFTVFYWLFWFLAAYFGMSLFDGIMQLFENVDLPDLPQPPLEQ